MRLLLIITLIGYVLYKIGFFRVWVTSKSRRPNFNDNQTKNNGDIRDDTKPNKKGYQGGEYIDYEEVK